MIFFKLLTHNFLSEASRNSESSNVISNTGLLRSNKIRHGHEMIIVTLDLLSKRVKFSYRVTTFIVSLWGIHFYVIVIYSISRIETYYTSCFEPTILNDLFKHGLCIFKELESLGPYCLIFEDLRVSTVRVLSTYLPALEEWIPINEGYKLIQIIFYKHLST